jgi:hypothetical protein
MLHTTCLVCFISTLNGRSKNKPIKTGASSGHIINLKRSILETFDIYDPTPSRKQFSHLNAVKSIFVEGKVHYSALFTFLVGWQAGAIRLPPGDIIFAQLACPLNDIIFYLHQE